MSENHSHPPVEFEDRAAARAEMRRDMLRAHTAVALVLGAILLLGIVAVFAAFRAATNLRRAELAEAHGRAQLLKAYTAQARAMRLAEESGARQAALGAITNAAAIGSSLDLRSEAVASLALDDLVQEGPLVRSAHNLDRVLMDSELRYYVDVGPSNTIDLVSLRDGMVAFSLSPGPAIKNLRREMVTQSFSADGQYLGARFASGGVMAWNVSTKEKVFSSGFDSENSALTTGPRRILTGLSFSSDSRALIYNDATDGQISIYDLASGRKLSSGVEVWEKMFRMRPDLKAVAVGNGDKVHLLDYPSGTEQRTLLHDSHVENMTWSPDGRRLAVSCEDGSIYMWDLAQNTHRRLMGHSELCVRLDFSPDGRLFLSGSWDGATRLWDVAQGRMLAVAHGLGHTFSRDGTRIGFWRPWDGFGIWRISPSEVYSTLVCDKTCGSLLTIDLSSDGHWCVGTQSEGLSLWNLSDGDRLRSVHRPGMYCARFAPDEKT
ncbi:MAG TPA: WD40 repeat domain-containing protein, partial [Verrucomicrobiae bacterium]